MTDLDARIKAALQARAASVQEHDLPPLAVPGRPPHRWLTPLLAAAAVLAVAVGVSVAVGVGRGSPSQHHPAAGPTPAPHTTAAPSPTPSSTGPGVPCYFGDTGCDGSPSHVFYEPLWPFANYAQAQQWEKVGRPSGASPWHADATATALFFTDNVLGFTDITEVTSVKITGGEAHIGVGYPSPTGQPHTAAVLHLVRYGSGGPWEVVGSDDTDFSIEQPAYGSAVTSPMTVGGRITGTDESITISVLTQGARRETIPPFPAGGDGAPWIARMPFSRSGVLIIVASTGGHVTAHERFAIQGVHTSA